MKYSILIVNYNLKDSISHLVSDIEKQFQETTNSQTFEILIFDNASKDESRNYFEKLNHPNLRYIYSEKNLGFGSAMNRLAQIANGEILILLNPDLQIPQQELNLPVWIEASLSSDRVLVAPNLVDSHFKPQANGGGHSGLLTFILQSLRFGKLIRALGLMKFMRFLFSFPLFKSSRYAKYVENFSTTELNSNREQNYDWVSGAFWVLRKEHFLLCRGFDENIFLYCEDEDLCRRLQSATRLQIAKSDRFYAIHSIGGTQVGHRRFSRAQLERLNSNIYFLRKWSGPLAAGTLRVFYFFYLLAFARFANAFQSLFGSKISDPSDNR